MLEKLATGLLRPINNKMIIYVFYIAFKGIVQEVFDLGKDMLVFL